MQGIYKITNKLSGKSYIGQSIHCGTRLEQHYSGHNPQFIDSVIMVEGIENFSFDILKEVDKKDLSYWEDYYIIKYNTYFPNGYNKKWNTTEEEREKITSRVILDIKKEQEGNNDWSCEKIMEYFNYGIFKLYCILWLIPQYRTENGNHFLIKKHSNSKFLHTLYPELSYDTVNKYRKLLVEKGILIEHSEKNEIEVINIPLITQYLDNSFLDLPAQECIIFWYIKYMIDIYKINIFSGIDFRWIYTMNSMGCYHSGHTITKARKFLRSLENKEFFKLDTSFSSAGERENYKYHIILQ